MAVQGILKGSIWTFTGRSLAAAGAITMNALMARLLTADAYGAFVLISSLTLFGSMVSCAGLRRGSVRLIAKYKTNSQSGQANTIIFVTVLVGLLLSIGIGVLSFYVLGDWLAYSVFGAPLVASIPLVLLFWLVFRTLQTLLAALLQGNKDLRGAVLVDGTIATLATVAGLLAYNTLASEHTFQGAMMIVVAGVAAGVLTGMAFLVPISRKLGKPETVAKADVINTALPLFVTAVALVSVSEAHIWLLGVMKPEEDVALFGAASRLVRFVSFPLLVVNTVLPPFVASEFAAGRKLQMQQLLQSAATICALPSLLIVIALVVFAGPIMGLVYGSFYESGALALIILCVAHALNVATGAPGILLAMSDRQSQLMWIAVTTGILGILISFILIPRFDVTGAAIGAGVGIALRNISLWLYARIGLEIKTQMSFASLPLVYWRVRGRLTALRQNKAGWARLDGLLARLERFYWRLRGRVVVECIGDSHTNIFNELNAQCSVDGIRFHATAVRGATAFGLANPNSRTNAFQIFSETIVGLPPGAPVIFLLGEVDLGFLIWIRAKEQGREPEKVMQEALSRYIDFLRAHANSRPIAVVSAPLPTIGDDAPTGNVAKLRAEVNTTQSERTKLTLSYNDHLREACQRLNIIFVSLDGVSLDPETGLVLATLMQAEKSDHHYDRNTYCSLLSDYLNKINLLRTFRQSFPSARP